MWARAGGAALLWVMLYACATSPKSVPLLDRRSVDEDVFAALLNAMMTEPISPGSTRAKLYVDPRPIREDASVLADQSAFMVVSEATVQRRRAIAARLGLDTADATFPRGCPGALTPRAPGSPEPAGCPRTERYVVVIGLPRVGDSDSTSAEADSSLRSVRVVAAGIGPSGISAEVRDYVLGVLGANWVVRRMRVRSFVE